MFIGVQSPPAVAAAERAPAIFIHEHPPAAVTTANLNKRSSNCRFTNNYHEKRPGSQLCDRETARIKLSITLQRDAVGI